MILAMLTKKKKNATMMNKMFTIDFAVKVSSPISSSSPLFDPSPHISRSCLIGHPPRVFNHFNYYKPNARFVLALR